MNESLKNFLLSFFVIIGVGFGSYYLYSETDAIENNKNLVDNSVTISSDNKEVPKIVIDIITDQEPFHMKFIEEYFNNKNIKLNITYVDEGLFQKAKNGDYDVIITKDSSEIIKAKEDKLLKKLNPKLLMKIPTNFRDKDGYWIIYSLRIRGFYVSNKYIENNGSIPYNYYELANPKYKNKICIRKLTHHYNLELFSQLYGMWGEDKFKKWLSGLIDNLAVKPSGNDRAQVQKIYNDMCEISVGNSYYLGLMRSNPNQKMWADNVKFIIPNQTNKGALALYSAAGTLKTCKVNQATLNEFYNYLISDYAQKLNSKLSFEYPIYQKDTSDESSTFGAYQGISYKNNTIKIHYANQNELYKNRVKVLKILEKMKN
jgi:iron(III) transport system substrate-binding protein